MNIKLKVILGLFLVLVVSSLTMSAGYPKIYSPYSLTVVIPLLALNTLGLSGILLVFCASLPKALLFFASTVPTMRGNAKVGRILAGLSAILMLLSIGFLFIFYDYGVQYQGKQHTLLMYLFNATLIGATITVFLVNFSRPTVNSSLLYSCLLFCWLGWCAFPWLGELI